MIPTAIGHWLVAFVLGLCWFRDRKDKSAVGASILLATGIALIVYGVQA